MEMSKKTDLRILRTKKLIGEAFIQLMQEKSYEAITIQNIADKALINRATFYLHYTDKQDLLNKISDEILQELASKYPPIDNQKKEFKISETELIVSASLETIGKNATFYRVMLGREGVNVFRNKLQELITNRLEKVFIEYGLKEEYLPIPKGLMVQYVYYLFMGIVLWWLNSGLIYSPQYMASLASRLLMFGYVQILGFKVDNCEQ